MRFLFLFMDGVGLGADDPVSNPLAKAEMPNLTALLGGKRLLAGSAPLQTERATLLGLDPVMGIDGLPQSATGQTSLITGKNAPERIGKHWGPKPNKETAAVLDEGTLFSTLRERGYNAALLNAYPQGYFDGINSGRRMYSAIPHGVTGAGITLKTRGDLNAGQALSADFTGKAWRDHLGHTDYPVMEELEAGHKLTELATTYDLAFFEYWLSDMVGHRQEEENAITLLESFDGVFGGLLETWDDDEGLILITSDHGNMEDLSTRRHTPNLVPGLVIGSAKLRERFAARLHTLADVTPAILQFYPQP
jgi:hypothetical protein